MYSLTVFEVSCRILLYYSGEYFVVTLPCPWRWTSLSMCTWLGNKHRGFFPCAAFVRILSPRHQKVRWGKVGRASVVTYNFVFDFISLSIIPTRSIYLTANGILTFFFMSNIPYTHTHTHTYIYTIHTHTHIHHIFFIYSWTLRLVLHLAYYK